MSTILLTGFEPFGGDSRNPSAEAVNRVAATYDGPHELVTATLPVSFAGSAAELGRLIDAHRPDAVVATGLAGGSARIAVERIGVNLMDARIADNDGHQPTDEACEPGGPAARFATLPVKRIVQALNDAGIPAHASLTAGSFVCNHVLYTALAAAERAAAGTVPVGFVHVPWSTPTAPEGAPHLSESDIARGIRIVLDQVFETEQRAVGGTVW